MKQRKQINKDALYPSVKGKQYLPYGYGCKLSKKGCLFPERFMSAHLTNNNGFTFGVKLCLPSAISGDTERLKIESISPTHRPFKKTLHCPVPGATNMLATANGILFFYSEIRHCWYRSSANKITESRYRPRLGPDISKMGNKTTFSFQVENGVVYMVEFVMFNSQPRILSVRLPNR